MSRNTALRLLEAFTAVVSLGNIAFGCLSMLAVELAFAFGKAVLWIGRQFFHNLPRMEDPRRYFFLIFILFPVLLSIAWFALQSRPKRRAWVAGTLCAAHGLIVAAKAAQNCVQAGCTLGQTMGEVLWSAVTWPVVSSIVIAACAALLYRLKEEPQQPALLPEGI